MRMPSYEMLVREHHALVYRVALGVLRDRAAAEDVAQEVFLEFLRHPEALESAGNTRAFVGRAAVNRALNTRRGEARRVKHEQAASPAEATMDPTAEDFRREVRARVAELPEGERLAIDLHYFQGFTIAETAAALDVADRTVYSRLSEACSKLRKALGAAAFVALLAGLEAELSQCGAEEVPSNLQDQLLRLGHRPGLARGSAGRRVPAVVLSAGMVALVAFLGARAFLDWRDSQISGESPSGSGNRSGGASIAREDTDSLSIPPVAAIDRDLDLHGTVVTEGGAPVEGALLATVTQPWRRANLLIPEFSHVDAPGARARSAADGSFAIRLRRGDIVILRVSAEGFASFGIPMCQAGEKLRIVLRPGVRLLARAVDEQGQVVAGVRLHLFKREPALELDFDFKEVTGPDGRCCIAGVPPACEAWLAAEHSALGGPEWLTVRLPGSGETRVDVPMERGRDISGRVTDSTTGKPIPGARVGMDWVMDAPVVADAEGRYRLLRWTGKNARTITADAEGYAQDSLEVGDATTLDFALLPGSTATARLVTQDHLPVPGARVSLVAYQGRVDQHLISCRNGVSDGDGRIRLSGLRRNMPHTLIAMADGFGRFLLDFDPDPESTGSVDLGEIVLPEGRHIEGRVLDATGNPVPRIRVTLAGFNPDRRRLRPDEPPLQEYYGCSESAASDDLGRFHFRDISPGNYRARVAPKGVAAVEAPVTVPPDHDIAGVELRISDSDGVNVLVVDDRGLPVEGVRVTGISDDDEVRATTGPDGRARLLLSDTSVTVSIGSGKSGGRRTFPPDKQVTTAHSRELTFVLAEAGTASGEVVTADGKPIAGAELEIISGGKGGTFVTADADGKFEALFPLPGPIDIVLIGRKVRKGGYALLEPLPGVMEGRLESVIAGSKDLRLVARPLALDRSLVVRLETPAGEPAAGAYVILSLRGSTLQSVEADEKGVASLSGLPGSRLEFLAYSPEQLDWLPVQLEVTPEGQDLPVKFHEGTWLEGIVTGPDGNKISGAEVSVSLDGKMVAFDRSRAGGRFKVLLDASESRGFDLEASGYDGGALKGALKGVRPGGSTVTLRLDKQ
jgi:RNA polymerase sigma factor (sigma-70 family)